MVKDSIEREKEQGKRTEWGKENMNMNGDMNFYVWGRDRENVWHHLIVEKERSQKKVNCPNGKLEI